MKKDIVFIDGNVLNVREYKGHRVVTIQDIARVHKIPAHNIQVNFERNRKHFLEEIDYFHLKYGFDMHKLFISKKARHINVFTESGYLMLVKSLTDEMSWNVQRELVNSYFKFKTVVKKVVLGPEIFFQYIIPYLPKEIQKICFYRQKGLTLEETKILTGTAVAKIRKIEQNLSGIGYKIQDQSGKRKSYFPVEVHDEKR